MKDTQTELIREKMTTQVPVLITWDVDPGFTSDQKREALRSSVDLCQEFGIVATFYFVARQASVYSEEISEMRQAGHEIGCHGLTHGSEEEYSRMPLEMQRDYIERATRLLEEQACLPITAFRGPRVKVSPTTLKVLIEFGYLTDSSVCSQRLDVLSSNLINTGWLTAPRLPYRPHKDNAFKRGNLDILEVPVSALVIPFISTSLYIFRLPLMKLLFRLLYLEASRTGKPIIYLAHPAEFGPQKFSRFKLSDLSTKNLRTHGLKVRKHLNVSDPKVRLQLNRELFSYIATFPNVRFITMREYVYSKTYKCRPADLHPTEIVTENE